MSLFAEPWGNYLLKDIVETSVPAAISWWPSTIGWQFVLLLILTIIIKKVYLAIKHYQKNAYRRDALLCLAEIVHANEAVNEPITEAATEKNKSNYRKLPALLRTTALHAFARSDISLLNGQAWEAWLDKQCDDSNFTSKCSGVLDKLAYQPNFSFSDSQLAQLSSEIEIWVKNHRSSND
jgi:hypothetical protein